LCTDDTIPKYDEMPNNMAVNFNISECIEKYLEEGIPDLPEVFKMK